MIKYEKSVAPTTTIMEWSLPKHGDLPLNLKRRGIDLMTVIMLWVEENSQIVHTDAQPIQVRRLLVKIAF